MRSYALTWEGATVKKLVVAACPNFASAAAIVAAAPGTGVAAASADDLEKLSGPTLAVLYNAVIDLAVEGDKDDAYVTRFKDREAGKRRVFDLIVTHFKDAPEAAAPATGDASAANETTTNEDEMATKGKKTKKAPKPKKAPRVKKERVAKAPKDRHYKAQVVSKGSEKAKGTALEMIQRANGATADEIKDRLGVSLGTAKNLVWYLRRDNHKIVVDRTKERKPYIIKD